MIEKNEISTIVFDIGNVLVKFDWEHYLDSFSFFKEIKEKVANATVKSNTWNELDQGIFTKEKMLQRFIENDPTIAEEITIFFKNMTGIIKQYDYTVPWILDWKEKGYQVLVLSNFPEQIYADCKEDMNFLQYTDGGIISFQEKMIKPNEDIYQLLLERYELTPNQCVFLDDREENLVTARTLGFHTVLFTTKEDAIMQLKKLGVE